MAAQPQPQSGEWASLKMPDPKDVAAVPEVGARAPSTSLLRLPNGRPTVVTFLRHCGCPFAEKTFKNMASLSSQHKDVTFIAVSHSSAEATERWILQVGGTWDVNVIVDDQRDLYAQWGLGLTTTWGAVGPSVLYSVFRMGMSEGIWNRPTESGTRWQNSGTFAVGRDGTVRWVHVATAASDIPDFDEALGALNIKPKA